MLHCQGDGRFQAGFKIFFVIFTRAGLSSPQSGSYSLSLKLKNVC